MSDVQLGQPYAGNARGPGEPGHGEAKIDTVAVVTIALTAVGLALAATQVVLQRRQVVLSRQEVKLTATVLPAAHRSVTLPQVTELAGYELFAPAARYAGYAERFLNRSKELRTLLNAVDSGRSVVVIEGLPGTGKTSLAAALCRRLRRHRVRWVFCGEWEQVTLGSLVKALAYDAELPADPRLRVLADRDGAGQAGINATIRYLDEHPLVLVLDDYHLMTDPDIAALVRALQRSKLRSTVLLVTRRRPMEVERVPLAMSHTLAGLSRQSARLFLRDNGVQAPDEVLDQIWAKAGQGVPEAMRTLAGLTRNRDIPHTLRSLPDYTADLENWVSRLLADLDPAQLRLAKLVALSYGPASRELLGEIIPPGSALDEALDELTASFVVTATDSGFRLHDLYGQHLRQQLSAAERDRDSTRIAQYYQRKARALLLGLGEQPSYGTLYLEAFPDYAGNTAGHLAFAADLMARLEDNAIAPPAGSRVLVLGSGNGIHDPGLARYRLDIVNLDVQADIAELGHARAAELNARISYLVADMTKPLPLAPQSMDAVFNIGSSFGFEEQDEDNAAIFRHAARALKPGKPFVFEYVNGEFWRQRRGKREAESVTLPNGSIRTTYAIFDPVAGTSLTSICLVRPDGSTGWLHHFMHYYRVDEVTRMMRDAGLEPVALYGGKDGRVVGSPFHAEESAGMVILAVRSPEPADPPPRAAS